MLLYFCLREKICPYNIGLHCDSEMMWKHYLLSTFLLSKEYIK